MRNCLDIKLLHSFYFLVSTFCFSLLPLSEVLAKDKPSVVCTTGIMADLLRNIAGESVNIKPLMGPGVDPHVYKPTHKDISLLRDADIIVYHGLTLEGKLEPILEKLEAKGKTVIAASEFGKKELLLACLLYTSDAADE